MGQILGSFIVGFDMNYNEEKDTTEGVLIVGAKQLGGIKHKKPVVINAFQGDEAMKIYKTLTTFQKEEKKEEEK